LAATIKKKYGIEPELIGGGGGIFDVKADGRMIFSKHEAGRFPEEAEVIDALAPQCK
jgi:predicted Rdx family selenoprotein